MMKKRIVLFSVTVMMAIALCGCGAEKKGKGVTGFDTPVEEKQEDIQEEAEPEEGKKSAILDDAAEGSLDFDFNSSENNSENAATEE